MATTILTIPTARLTPLTLWHLLSLDAPSVATLWTVFAARALHQPLPATLAPTMFLAVWLLYAADRLLDAQPRTTSSSGSTQVLPIAELQLDLQPRHLFHRAHRLPFAFAILLATSSLAILIPTLPLNLLRPYLVLAALLAVWFVLIHLTRLPLPKEFAPGPFFAAAVFLPFHTGLPSPILFAALCTLNCLYIHAWEHPAHSTRPASASLTCRHLPAFTVTLALLALAHPIPISIAITLAALVLLTLNHRRHELPPTTLRAAADLALLTPLLVLPFLP